MKKRILGLTVLFGLCPASALLNGNGLEFCNQAKAASYSRVGNIHSEASLRYSSGSEMNVREFMPIEYYPGTYHIIPTGAYDILFANGYPVQKEPPLGEYDLAGFKFTGSGHVFFGDFTNISVSSSGAGNYIKSIGIGTLEDTSSEGTVKFGSNAIFGISTKATKRADVTTPGLGALYNVNDLSVGGCKLLIAGELEDGGVYDIITGTNLPTSASDLWDLKNDVLMLDPNWQEKYELAYLPLDGNMISIAAIKIYEELKPEPKIYIHGTDADDVLTAVADKSNSGTLGYDFVKNVVDSVDGNGIISLNSAINIGEMGGASRGLFTVSSLAADGTENHLAGLKNVDGKFQKEVWASFLHNHSNITGIATGSISSNSKDQYNGAIVGADLWDYKKDFGGVAVIYGGGTLRAEGEVASNRNEADYYGMAIYNRHEFKDFSLLADVSCIHAKNDIIQFNSDYELKADPHAMIYGAGIRAQQEYLLGSNITVMPFAGIRYSYLKNNNYSDNLAITHKSDNQGIFTPKIGVKIQSSYDMEGWKVEPSLTVGYLWNMGVKDITQRAFFNGTSNSYEFDIADSNCYFVKMGVQASRGTGIFSLEYEYNKGHMLKENRWNITCSWTF